MNVGMGAATIQELVRPREWTVILVLDQDLVHRRIVTVVAAVTISVKL